jgi:hypothetical protein
MGDLKEVGKELARALEERLKADVEMNGNKLMLHQRSSTHLRPKDVKMQVKHVLHRLGFSHGYKVLSEHALIRIIRDEKKQRRVEREGVAPRPSQSLPYLFPT